MVLNQTITINAATIDTTITLDSVNIGLTGCKTILGTSGTVVVNPNPTARIVSNDPICSGEAAIFTVTGTAGAVLSYTTGTGTATQTLALDGTNQTITINAATDRYDHNFR